MGNGQTGNYELGSGVTTASISLPFEANDADYKIATLTKQVALLKDGKSPEDVENAQVLEAGSNGTGADKIDTLAKGVRAKAWGPDAKKE